MDVNNYLDTRRMVVQEMLTNQAIGGNNLFVDETYNGYLFGIDPTQERYCIFNALQGSDNVAAVPFNNEFAVGSLVVNIFFSNPIAIAGNILVSAMIGQPDGAYFKSAPLIRQHMVVGGYSYSYYFDNIAFNNLYVYNTLAGESATIGLTFNGTRGRYNQ